MNDFYIKDAVRARDGNRCVDCGVSEQEYHRRLGSRPRRFDVHQVQPDEGYSLENCVTLCKGCHRRRHQRKPNRPHHRAVFFVDPEVATAIKIAAAKGSVSGSRVSISDVVNSVLRKELAADILFARNYTAKD